MHANDVYTVDLGRLGRAGLRDSGTLGKVNWVSPQRGSGVYPPIKPYRAIHNIHLYACCVNINTIGCCKTSCYLCWMHTAVFCSVASYILSTLNVIVQNHSFYLCYCTIMIVFNLCRVLPPLSNHNFNTLWHEVAHLVIPDLVITLTSSIKANMVTIDIPALVQSHWKYPWTFQCMVVCHRKSFLAFNSQSDYLFSHHHISAST